MFISRNKKHLLYYYTYCNYGFLFSTILKCRNSYGSSTLRIINLRYSFSLRKRKQNVQYNLFGTQHKLVVLILNPYLKGTKKCLKYLQLVDVVIILGVYKFCCIRPCTKASKLYSSDVAHAFTFHAYKESIYFRLKHHIISSLQREHYYAKT